MATEYRQQKIQGNECDGRKTRGIEKSEHDLSSKADHRARGGTKHTRNEAPGLP